MSAANEKGKYEIVPIEGTVNDRAVILWVPERYFTASTLLVENTTLANFMSSEAIPKGDAITNGFGSYVYREQLPKAGGSLRFVFLKNKTETEQLEVVKPVRETMEPVDWPDWLVSLYALKVNETIEVQTGAPSIGSTPATTGLKFNERYYDRYALIKGGRYNSFVTYSEYFSPALIQSFVATEPRPMPVFYNLYGMANRFDCLHDTITVPQIGLIQQIVPDFGTERRLESWDLTSIFPRTNHVGWIAHTREVDCTPRDGGYYYNVKHVTPPEYEKKILV